MKTNIEAGHAQLKARLEQALIDAQKRISQAVLQKVRERTPTRTGRAKAAWNLSVGQPVSIVPPEGQETYETEGVSEVSVENPFGTVFVSNNLDYIIDLEFGSSNQAPQGMARLTLEEIKDK